MSSSYTKIGTFVGELSGKEYSVVQRDYSITSGLGSDRVIDGVDIYSTECGLALAAPNSDDKLFSSDLNEFLVKKES